MEGPYTIEIATDEAFMQNLYIRENIPYNFYSLDVRLKPGKYFWRYRLGKKDSKEVSKSRVFDIKTETTKSLILPSREHRYENASIKHPRIWLNYEQIEAFRETLEEDSNAYGFQEFLEMSVESRLHKAFPQEPEPYEEDIKDRRLWRYNYM